MTGKPGVSAATAERLPDAPVDEHRARRESRGAMVMRDRLRAGR
jgi:hypothetical protein